jgi:hypothetical protein
MPTIVYKNGDQTSTEQRAIAGLSTYHAILRTTSYRTDGTCLRSMHAMLYLTSLVTYRLI